MNLTTNDQACLCQLQHPGVCFTPELWAELAAEYEAAPEAAHPGWDELRACGKAYAHQDGVEYAPRRVYVASAAQYVDIETERCEDPQPYHKAEDLFEDCAQGRYQLPVDFGAHPLWSTEDWGAYLFWHDLEGHVETGFDFTPDGELQAFYGHIQGRSDAFAEALFAQQLYPIAYAITHHKWLSAKAALAGPKARSVIEAMRGGA